MHAFIDRIAFEYVVNVARHFKPIVRRDFTQCTPPIEPPTMAN